MLGYLKFVNKTFSLTGRTTNRCFPWMLRVSFPIVIPFWSRRFSAQTQGLDDRKGKRKHKKFIATIPNWLVFERTRMPSIGIFGRIGKCDANSNNGSFVEWTESSKTTSSRNGRVGGIWIRMADCTSPDDGCPPTRGKPVAVTCWQKQDLVYTVSIRSGLTFSRKPSSCLPKGLLSSSVGIFRDMFSQVATEMKKSMLSCCSYVGDSTRCPSTRLYAYLSSKRLQYSSTYPSPCE